MYAGLRTNLPREVMAYTDFAFDDLAGQSKDSRRFPSHEEVCLLSSRQNRGAQDLPVELCEDVYKFAQHFASRIDEMEEMLTIPLAIDSALGHIMDNVCQVSVVQIDDCARVCHRFCKCRSLSADGHVPVSVAQNQNV